MVPGDIGMWVDNFDVCRFKKSPEGSRDVGFHCTAISIVPGLSLRIPLQGWPSFKDLARGVNPVIQEYEAGVRKFLQGPADLIYRGGRKLYEEVRCPLDVRRKNPTHVPWYPKNLINHNVTSNAGLVAVLQHIAEYRRPIGQATLPVLMDINIFWRVMKLTYHRSTPGVALRPALSRICPLFGLWHAYKQCINLTCKKFAPFFVPVEYDTHLSSPETTRAYA